MATIVCNGTQPEFILSDAANLTQWPLVVDGPNQFVIGIPFTPTIITGVTGLPADATPAMLAVNGQTVTAPGYAPALAAAIAARLQAVGAYAQAYEQGGTTVSGQHWDTDDATQAKLNAAYNLATAGKQSTFNWWMSTGWVQFTAAQIEAMAPAVGIWVEEVYTNLQAHMVAIEALTAISAVNTYNFTTGWPTGT